MKQHPSRADEGHESEAEASAVALRQLRREHNRQVQELLRRAQVQESRSRRGADQQQGAHGRSGRRRSCSGPGRPAPEADLEEAEAQPRQRDVAVGPDHSGPEGQALAKSLASTALSKSLAKAVTHRENAELQELRALNRQLAEAAARGRAELARGREELAQAQQESELQALRIDRLGGQLAQLATVNDDLEEQLEALQ
ncbi:unnamed protein product, partial [Prorocentrum cordatum]